MTTASDLTQHPSFQQYVETHINDNCPCDDCQFDRDIENLAYLTPSIPSSPVEEDPPTSPTINGNNGSFTNTDDHAHQHTAGNGQFMRSASHLARNIHRAENSIPAQAIGLGALGFPAAMYYSDTQLVKPSKQQKPHSYKVISSKDERLQVYNPSFDDRVLRKNSKLPEKVTQFDKLLVGVESNPGPSKSSSNEKWNWEAASHTPETILEDTTPGSRYTHVLRPSTGPSNREMHAINGNSMNKATMPSLKRKKKLPPRPKAKAKSEPKYKKRPVQRTVAKSRSKVLPREISLVRRLAAKYMYFLKNPNTMPPRIGGCSQGTCLVHGYFINTYSFININGLPTTDYVFALNPKVYAVANSGPISVYASNGSTIPFSDATNAINQYPVFSNQQAIFDMFKYTTSARYLGGSVSIDCRCPATDRAAYLYAGLCPRNTGAADPPNSTTAQTLRVMSSADIRAQVYTTELPGRTASSVYIPSSVGCFIFSHTPFLNTESVINSPIPFVGMTGCNNNHTVTTIVSMWFEAQMDSRTSSFAGFASGPRVNSEDIFDELKPFPTVSSKIIPTGPRSASSSLDYVQTMMPMVEPQTQEDKLLLKVSELEEKYSKLSLRLDEEDEKFVDITDNHLSQSTIDLAKTLRQLSTPGSKTTPKTLP